MIQPRPVAAKETSTRFEPGKPRVAINFPQAAVSSGLDFSVEASGENEAILSVETQRPIRRLDSQIERNATLGIATPRVERAIHVERLRGLTGQRQMPRCRVRRGADLEIEPSQVGVEGDGIRRGPKPKSRIQHFDAQGSLRVLDQQRLQNFLEIDRPFLGAGDVEIRVRELERPQTIAIEKNLAEGAFPDSLGGVDDALALLRGEGETFESRRRPP